MSVNIGDRISYVMVKGHKGSKNYENSEDPILVLKNDLPIDFDYYIEKQIKPPLERLLKKTGIIANLDSLFYGEHTKNRYIPKVNQNSVLGKFIPVYEKCLNCGIKVQGKALCPSCKPKEPEVYLKIRSKLQACIAEKSDLWTECNNCQGSVFMEIICENLDCPIFFKRTKNTKDLA